MNIVNKKYFLLHYLFKVTSMQSTGLHMGGFCLVVDAPCFVGIQQVKHTKKSKIIFIALSLSVDGENQILSLYYRLES